MVLWLSNRLPLWGFVINSGWLRFEGDYEQNELGFVLDWSCYIKITAVSVAWSPKNQSLSRNVYTC